VTKKMKKKQGVSSIECATLFSDNFRTKPFSNVSVSEKNSKLTRKVLNFFYDRVKCIEQILLLERLEI
jgi:hypothetical protein